MTDSFPRTPPPGGNRPPFDPARITRARLLAYLSPQRFSFAVTVLSGIGAGLAPLALLSGWSFLLTAVWGTSPMMEALLPDWPRPLAYAALGALLPALMLVRGGLVALHRQGLFQAGHQILHGLRSDLFANLMRQSTGFYQPAKTGELIQLLFHQTRLVQSGATRLLDAATLQATSVLGIVGFLLLRDWGYAVGSLLLLCAALPLVRSFRERTRQTAATEEADTAAHVRATQEVLGGIRLVKTLARERSEQERFLRADLRTLAHAAQGHRATALTAPLLASLAVVGLAAGLVYAKLTAMSPAQFLVLNTALAALCPPLRALSQTRSQLEPMLTACAKVFEFIDRKPEVCDAEDATPLQQPRGEIILSGVRFAYPEAPQDALRDCSAIFRPGRVHALAGWPGSGKSTLLSLILRFHDPRDGSISLDGTDLRQITQDSLRNHITVVNQDLFLFRDTIRNNILYGRPNASEDEVIAAAQRASAHEFILDLPGGYDAVVGEPGCILSGGRQQRIALARAFLRQAPILLLDDTYFSLDPESEQKIEAAIDELCRGKTVIAIPHRLSSLLKADEIFVLDAGQIVDSGRHEELLARCEVYRQLCERHFRAPDLATPATMATL
jgi:subfamily B ATP-binding cassette protein MsbA